MNFKHTLPIQIRFNDVDKYGHVNNSVYFSYYDLAKTSYISDIRSVYHLDNAFDSIVVVNINADFLAPIFGATDVAVQTCISEVGNKSFTLQQQVISIEKNYVEGMESQRGMVLPSGAKIYSVDGEVKCVCRSVMVAYDISTQSSRAIPQEWKEAFCDFEGHDVLRH